MHGAPGPGKRGGSGGRPLFRYVRKVSTYDPVSGAVAAYPPARRLMLTALARWMQDFQVDGFRLDSLETVANWDFIGEFSQAARDQFRNARNLGAGADARFLVVGEELEHPIGLIAQKRVDGLWNDNFRNYIRPALLGSNAREEPSFEWTVRKAIDARLHGFGDCAQAVNYLGSHDVEGVAKERLCTFFRYAGLDDGEILRRTKLAFACLLTSVGIPMILAGDEFGDEHDSFDRLGHVTHEGGKQVDPVNFSRLEGPGNQWRRDLLKYVSNLIASRTSCPGLGRNEIDFIHVDFAPGRRVMAWKRGTDADPVVVVANFSDFESGADPEYRVTGWPTVSGRQWYEVTQGRNVPAVWVGREPVFRWEAKVYALRP